MALLAIKGHAVRGSEVIALLEMLGGINNRFKFDGLNEESIYYICPEYNNDIHSAIIPTNQIVFSLEEFEEKFPYKVGGKVIYEDKRREITKMVWKQQTNTVAYKLDDKLYCNVINKLQPYKEETMETAKITITPQRHWNEDKIELEVTNGYEIKEENGKYYAIKKQPKYPKTYAECCEVLGMLSGWHLTLELNTPATHDLSVTKEFDYVAKLEPLRKLLICCKAYWKIAGEQMGLGKPWEPDWYDIKQLKFGIHTVENQIRNITLHVLKNLILVFPTEEMRNAFYENFKELIEAVKELL